MDIEVTNSPELSVVEPQSVPSRISVVLIEKAKVGGTQCLGCPRVDQDLRLLAGVAKPASVTVCEDSHVSPCVGGGGGGAVLFRPCREAVSQLTHNVFSTLLESFAELIWDKRCSNIVATFAQIYFESTQVLN